LNARLRAVLSGGPVASTASEEAAEQVGIGRWTLFRAKARLHIEAKPSAAPRAAPAIEARGGSFRLEDCGRRCSGRNQREGQRFPADLNIGE